MCGFVGIFSLSGLAPDDWSRRFDLAMASIRYRGPDDESRLYSNSFMLGHARLSIIDLSAAARQPMLDRSGRYILLFNGEIYNYRELAAELLADDNELNRCSDTAVLLAMYVRFGRDCLRYLNGMFSFVVIDQVEHHIFFARDRFGEKPLYWLRHLDHIAFSSELRALKALIPDADWSIDPESFRLYNSLGSVPAPYTIYCCARSIPAASWMLLDAQGVRSEAVYWTLSDAKSPLARNREEAIHLCRELLLDAVGSRFVSDVPVGLFLSGGLDSGSILSLASSLDIPRPRALCIDFPETQFSEYHLASQSARHFGVPLDRALVTSSDFLSHLDSFFRSADQPTSDGFNSYIVSLHAKELGVKVWLSGMGGDELFGGYSSFRLIRQLTRISHVLQHIPAANHHRKLIERTFPHYYRLARVANLSRRGNPILRAYQSLRNIIPSDMMLDMLSPAMQTSAEGCSRVLDNIYPDLASCVDDFQATSLLESTAYMSSQLLRDSDNFSMAHSIELRAPFLDHRLFQFVYSLSKSLKQDGRRNKSLLVDALANPLPPTIVNQSKLGFIFPMELWLKENLTVSFETHVLHSCGTDFWNPQAIRGLWNAYLAGRVHWSVPWQIYAFSRWYGAQHGQCLT